MAAAGRFGGLARRRADQQLAASEALPPPANRFIQRLLIIFGPGGAISGVFVYSGTPGAGNPPVDSMTPPGTTQDPYLNTGVIEGISSYFHGAFGQASNMDGGAFNLFTGPGSGLGPWVNAGTLTLALLANTWELSKSLQADGNFYAKSPIPPTSTYSTLKAIRGAAPGTVETWQDATPLLNANFAAGGTNPRFQFLALGTNGRVAMDGAINITGAVAANTAMFNLPVGYRPARQLGFQQTSNSGGLVLGASVVQVNTTGDVVLNPATAAGKFVLLDGIEFAID